MATKNNKNQTEEQETKAAEIPEPSAEQGKDAGEVSPLPEKPKVLTALRPILYLAKQYKVGDALPVNNPEMVEAWLEAKSAKWMLKGEEAKTQFP